VWRRGEGGVGMRCGQGNEKEGGRRRGRKGGEGGELRVREEVEGEGEGGWSGRRMRRD